jgi:hypothetical protein
MELAARLVRALGSLRYQLCIQLGRSSTDTGARMDRRRIHPNLVSPTGTLGAARSELFPMSCKN